MGMRGEYDRAMKTDDPAAVVQHVLRTQRSLIKDVHDCEETEPQLIALYRKVQEYWDSGRLDVPEDVTLLFADDNFGSIRRLPTGNEIHRKGGAGFWHQLQEAHRRNARQIWVLNVGDIKPMEIPLSFVIQLACDINSVSATTLPAFLQTLTQREFGFDPADKVTSFWRRQDSNPLVGQMGVAIEGHAGIRPGHCNEETDRMHPSRRDLISGVTLGTLNWECKAPYDWIKLAKASGRISPENDNERLYIDIDWAKVPTGFNEEILIDIKSTDGTYGPYGDDFEQVHLPIINRPLDGPLSGYVEADGYVYIPASAAIHLTGYRTLPNLGITAAGAVSIDPDAKDASFSVYQVYIFDKVDGPYLELHFNMILDVDPSHVMKYDIKIDDVPITTYRLAPEPDIKGELAPGWYHAVQDCAWTRRNSLELIGRGSHEIRVGFQHSNILLEKVILDLCGVKPSYLVLHLACSRHRAEDLEKTTKTGRARLTIILKY
ncbi:hypothetical protein SCUP234_08102 [Seiridium cupressi]